MRRFALLCCAIVSSGSLAGCTGTGVFLDHTFNLGNPNTPAGNSEMFLRLRGEPVAITPLLPESGNVWPGPQKPDPTIDELQQSQGMGASPGQGQGGPRSGPTPGGNDVHAPPAILPSGTPGSKAAPPQRNSGGGNTVDVTGGEKIPNYRQLQPPAASKGILVPNGNGTSTLIGPDGSITTVPTKP